MHSVRTDGLQYVTPVTPRATIDLVTENVLVHVDRVCFFAHSQISDSDSDLGAWSFRGTYGSAADIRCLRLYKHVDRGENYRIPIAVKGVLHLPLVTCQIVNIVQCL